MPLKRNSATKLATSLTAKIISLNVKGLNTPEKRSQTLLEMQKHKANIVFLQETHFRSNAIPKLFSRHFPIVYHATNPLAKTKGVAILIHKNCPFQYTDMQSDKEGRFLFLKGSYAGRTITLANIQGRINIGACGAAAPGPSLNIGPCQWLINIGVPS